VEKALRCLWLLPLISLLGCVNEARSFRGPDGHIAVCSAAGAGLIPALMAKDNLEQCSSEYLKSGYVKVTP
jgi:hypothetical protein